MAFNETNLPDTLLQPPIPAPNSFVQDTWERNWSIYFIGRHWNGPEKGILTTLARWSHEVSPTDKRLSRQRIQAILGATAWALRDYSDAELGINRQAT